MAARLRRSAVIFVAAALPRAVVVRDKKSQALFESAGVVSAAVAVSRITGLLRESVLAWLFGAGATFDAYVLAYRIPNLARDLFAYQVATNPPYAAFAAARGFDATRLPARLEQIPAVPAAAFKAARLACFPPAHTRAWFETSGTTGGRGGRHELDTTRLYEAALLASFDRGLLPDGARLRYLCLVPDPRERPHMSFYYPVRQQISLRLIQMCMVVRTAGPPTAVASSVRAELRQIEPRLPVQKIDTVNEQVDDVLFQERLIANLSICFGVAAILLACMGLYGVMSYTVAQRTNEVGIRMALGARRSHVLAMVLRESIVLALAGILIGVPAALAVAPVVENRLFRVGPSDPAAIGGAALLMIVVAVAAGMVPARHASRLDPMEALRYE